MAANSRWWICCIFCLWVTTSAIFAQDNAVIPPAAPPTAITEDARHLLELGQLLMGQNNQTYALKSAAIDMAKRNETGEQALRIFRQLVTRYPDFADGWLWLGISLTERLQYTKKHPEGEPLRSKENIQDGINAFQKAYECRPDDLVCVLYYGEALMTYRQDFDKVRALWEQYLQKAKTDMQKVTSLTQAARACLNKAYFGASNKKLTTEAAKQQLDIADKYINQAMKICPNAPDVKSMKALLQQYRNVICGKKNEPVSKTR